MDDNLRKTIEDPAEFAEFFKVVLPYLSATQKAVMVELATLWANAAIARRGAA